MFNYGKLFADGNVVGIRDGIIDKIFVYQIKNRAIFEGKIDINCYKNEFLAYNETTIEYVIKLDDNGNITEKLFDRKRDMPKRPELKK